MPDTMVSRVLGVLGLLCIAALGPAHAAGQAPFKVPADSTIPAGPEGEAVRLGKALITDTKKLLPHNVGNGLNCTNCHLGAGTVATPDPSSACGACFRNTAAATAASTRCRSASTTASSAR